MSEMQSSPKKLTRPRANRVIAGVCAGLAQYLGLDPTVVRVLFVLISLFGGGGLLAYIVLLLLMPEEQA